MALESNKHLTGYYKHKEQGTVVKINEIPGLGNPVADAFVQVGYEYIGTEKPSATPTKKTK